MLVVNDEYRVIHILENETFILHQQHSLSYSMTSTKVRIEDAQFIVSEVTYSEQGGGGLPDNHVEIISMSKEGIVVRKRDVIHQPLYILVDDHLRIEQKDTMYYYKDTDEISIGQKKVSIARLLYYKLKVLFNENEVDSI